MNRRSWWNGFFTLAEIISLGFFVRFIWLHDFDGIIGLTFLAVLFGMLWFASFVEK
jgi:hypothetical protein